MPGRAAEIAPATSPSETKWIRAPVRRISLTSDACRGRSSTHTVTSPTSVCLALATRRMFSATGAPRSITSAASGPTASFSI